MTDLALYTTVYPGVERFLADWYRSVRNQADQDFQLWIGVDGLEIEEAVSAIGEECQATWVRAERGDTHAQVRQRALLRIAKSFDAVVLVDSDDVLHPSRVEAARRELIASDVTGCALRLVEESGADLSAVMSLEAGEQPGDVLPRYNIFGLSNSAYSSAALRRCLPIPSGAVLVDWCLATRAWLCGLSLHFDQQVRMDYRQHGANTARVRPPFTSRRVSRDTSLVRGHFAILRSIELPGALPERIALLHETAQDIDLFWQRVVMHPRRLERYVQDLNALPPRLLWWWCVAHPSLRDLWTGREERP